MKSMTGYGSGTAEAAAHGLLIEVEITSVNRKTLDAFVSAPREWVGLDQRCTEWLKKSYERGRINVQIKVSSSATAQSGINCNAQQLDQAIEQLQDYAKSRNIAFEINSSLLLELTKMLKDTTGLPAWSEIETDLKRAFDQALNDIDDMRAREGEALAADLSQRIDELDNLRETIESKAAHAVTKYRDAMLERLKQLQLDVDLNDERVLKEVALFADRSDISEEITRLKSHFQQFREFIKSDSASGRKMDFLCQEIHREFNTTGSKSTLLEITRAVLEGKNGLERIREQVQNVE